MLSNATGITWTERRLRGNRWVFLPLALTFLLLRSHRRPRHAALHSRDRRLLVLLLWFQVVGVFREATTAAFRCSKLFAVAVGNGFTVCRLCISVLVFVAKTLRYKTNTCSIEYNKAYSHATSLIFQDAIYGTYQKFPNYTIQGCAYNATMWQHMRPHNSTTFLILCISSSFYTYAISG